MPVMKSFFDDGERARLLERLRALEPEQEPLWGRMSAHQMVCHLADTLRMAVGERPVVLTRTRYPRPVMRWIALWLPLPWPRGFPAPREVRQGRGGTPPELWERDLEALETLMERFSRERPAAGSVHPVFGPLSVREWDRWAWLHTDHHLRQFGL